MNCRDLLSFQYASQFKLLAGDRALGNEISWVHYMDSLDSIDWLRGGELVITSAFQDGEESNRLCKLAESLMEKKAAGLVIIGYRDIPGGLNPLISQCMNLDFPLFEMAPSTRIIDICKCICTAIVHQQKKIDERERLLLELIHGVRLSDKRLQKLSDIGITADKTWRIVCIQLHLLEKNNLARDSESSAFHHNRLSEDYIVRVKNFVQRYLERNQQFGILFSEEENIFWITEVSTEGDISDYLNDTLYNIKVSFPGIRIHAGVSEKFSEVKNLRNAVNHAIDTLKLSSQKSELVHVSFYDDMVGYQLIRNVSSVKTLEEMSSRILKDLLLPENTDLLNTLMVYLSCDCSAKRTAEKMFLHSNTLHYRLRKIESLLHRDLKKNEDLFDVMLAVKMYIYMQKLQ